MNQPPNKFGTGEKIKNKKKKEKKNIKKPREKISQRIKKPTKQTKNPTQKENTTNETQKQIKIQVVKKKKWKIKRNEENKRRGEG